MTTPRERVSFADSREDSWHHKAVKYRCQGTKDGDVEIEGAFAVNVIVGRLTNVRITILGLESTAQ